MLPNNQMQKDSPIQSIIDMRQQGLSNNQIIQNLQRQAYSNTQIFDAMNQADTKAVVTNIPPEFSQMPDIENPIQPKPEFSSQPPQETEYNSGEQNIKTEEYIEAIIDEKWNDLIRDVNKIIEWKNRTESRIVSIEQKVESLKDSFDQLHQAVIGKISEYDKHILDVGTEIKAMEKVFSKVLPSFTENVHALSRITENFKKGKKP